MNILVKIWLNIGILGENKIGLQFGFCVCHFIGIGLVSVCHFPENDISNQQALRIFACISNALQAVHRRFTGDYRRCITRRYIQGVP